MAVVWCEVQLITFLITIIVISTINIIITIISFVFFLVIYFKEMKITVQYQRSWRLEKQKR